MPFLEVFRRTTIAHRRGRLKARRARLGACGDRSDRNGVVAPPAYPAVKAATVIGGPL